MKMTTSWKFETEEVKEELGIVFGSAAKSRNIVRDWFADIRNFLGHEIIEYKELLDKSRKVALYRMQEQAKELGANGIINIRIQTSEVSSGVAEVIAYGTAVRLK